MYTTPADAPGTYFWNDGTANYTDTAMVNCIDGPPGTAASCQTGEANTAFLVGATGEPDYPFAAAEYCDGLSAHGYDDWYLPAQDELNVLYSNKNTGDLNGTFNESGSFPAGYYWSSSELNSSYARYQRFSDGLQPNFSKNLEIAVRCVRKVVGGGGCTNPSGQTGEIIFNSTEGVFQGCTSAGWQALHSVSGGGGPPCTANIPRYCSILSRFDCTGLTFASASIGSVDACETQCNGWAGTFGQGCCEYKAGTNSCSFKAGTGNFTFVVTDYGSTSTCGQTLSFNVVSTEGSGEYCAYVENGPDYYSICGGFGVGNQTCSTTAEPGDTICVYGGGPPDSDITITAANPAPCSASGVYGNSTGNCDLNYHPYQGNGSGDGYCTGGGGCVNPSGQTGEIVYNSSENLFQGCTAASWQALHQ